MRNLSAGNVGGDVLTPICLQRRSASVQQILSVSNVKLDGLSFIADKVNEVSHFDPVVNSVASNNSVIQSLKDEITDLRAEIKRMFRPIFRQTSRNRRENSNFWIRNSSHTRKTNSNQICWYHRRFAEKAVRCVGHCNFQEN
ncbi:hypothetical protein AVEN_57128-1 [Araneus ventricosus]|uniref:Uncharacterized protein n=1 Tax=Araneus ventricosus TaxID=182803 RepID=A0A4Y2HA07_ARAVE|nr:hypothetical protein AVEN_57128-1 [Araneus ventricosus]